MPNDILDLTPRTRGPAAKAPPRVAVLGPITDADLVVLAAPRDSRAPAIARLRDSHHRLAKCLASGMTPGQAGAQTGYSLSRISVLQADTSFRDLIEVYRRASDAAFTQYTDVAVGNMVLGERLINESLEAIAERDEPLGLPELRVVREIVADRQDRFGYPRQAVNHSVSHDLADRLAAARRRSGLVLDLPSVPAPSEPVT